MELNWSTFLLEIINFLVLVWILKHFLYRPILSMLEQRRLKIEQSLSDAENFRTEATELEQKYKQRLKDWELEKQQLREALNEEIQQQRTQKLQRLQTELDSEREKNQLIEQLKQAELVKQQQLLAHQQAARFASKLLTSLVSQKLPFQKQEDQPGRQSQEDQIPTGKALESALLTQFINSFNELNEDRRSSLQNACEAAVGKVSISSAYVLSESQRLQLQQTLATVCPESLQLNYQQDPQLIAGLRIVIGASVLSLNLYNELNGFVELARENS